MLQAVFVVVMLIIGKLIYDSYMEQTSNRPKKEKKSRKGDIIDLSEAWVSLDNLPFRKRENLLSARELGLFNLFSRLLESSSYIAVPKLRMSEIFYVAPDADKRQEYQNRLKDKTVELLICELPNFKPVLIVLADNETEARKKQLSDRFIKSAAQAGGLPLLNVTSDLWEDELLLVQELQNLGIIVRRLH
ncbi:MAG TPA: DUF2726 domain-containing protein [Syntrophomonadaceae bacterium]|nr:DUF2726 domain-containing protein [Syntrophomonadaceae bacterium]HNX29280.1 DUF2726 domain-containing protein [Syntrophomonadaceae bacterium]HPR94078.1 DUF2726 domain-containing protein [Syntrophomonadaceae bacterium]